MAEQDPEPFTGRLFSSKHVDPTRDVALQIKGASRRTLKGGDVKWVVEFTNDKRCLALNVTNETALRRAYGPPPKWAGRAIYLVRGMTTYDNAHVPCVLVRTPELPPDGRAEAMRVFRVKLAAYEAAGGTPYDVERKARVFRAIVDATLPPSRQGARDLSAVEWRAVAVAIVDRFDPEDAALLPARLREPADDLD